MSRIRANQITNQAADGAPTVQNGLVISGVTTSTTFSGSGASLTNLNASNIASGTVPTARLGSGTANSSTFLRGDSTFATVTSTTINNNADNRLITGSGTANTLEGESNLTFDGNNLAMSGTGVFTITRNSRTLTLEGNYGNEGHPAIKTSSGHDLRIFTNGNNEKLRILSTGGVGVGTDNPEVNGGTGGGGLHLHGPATDNVRIKFTTPTKSNPGSTIGYYGLNRFGIDTYDGIEMRDVTRSYATIFKIDQNGYMTTNQPYGHLRFNVHNDTGSFVTQTSVHTSDVQNGMSHNGSGRLTVPVAGKYMLMLACNLYDSSSMQFRMMKNGSDIAGSYWQQSDGDTYWRSGMRSMIIPLSANDYIESKIIGKQDSQVWNHLTVYLLG